MIIGPKTAFVAYNNQDDPDIPFPGAFKVICPDIYGHAPDRALTLPQEDLAALAELSPWVRPKFSSPLDFFVPELGEGVYINFMHGDERFPVVDGFFPSEDFKNLFDSANRDRDGISQHVAEKATDRVFATRNGSVIKIEDKPEGKLSIEVFGKTRNAEGDKSTRLGPLIELDPATDAEKITLKARTKDGAAEQTIVMDMTKDDESILVTDKAGQFVKLSSKNGDEIIRIEDVHGNFIEFDKDSSATSGMNITVNGLKRLATEDYVDWVKDTLLEFIKSHRHMGNMGGPTPLFPADLAQLITIIAQFTSDIAPGADFLTNKMTGT